jgi:hypothetical protein
MSALGQSRLIGTASAVAACPLHPSKRTMRQLTSTCAFSVNGVRADIGQCAGSITRATERRVHRQGRFLQSSSASRLTVRGRCRPVVSAAGRRASHDTPSIQISMNTPPLRGLRTFPDFAAPKLRGTRRAGFLHRGFPHQPRPASAGLFFWPSPNLICGAAPLVPRSLGWSSVRARHGRSS